MMAVQLQGAGYNVLHLAYHNAPGQSWRITGVKLETFFRGIDWLKARPEVNPNALALVGYSKGAEAALLTSTHRPDLKAVVAGMPSSVAWDGMSFRSFIFGGASSWSHKGEKVASLSYDGMGPKGNEMLPLFANVLKDPGVRRDAEIPGGAVRRQAAAGLRREGQSVAFLPDGQTDRGTGEGGGEARDAALGICRGRPRGDGAAAAGRSQADEGLGHFGRYGAEQCRRAGRQLAEDCGVP
jgi:hypothetical protein